MIIILKGMVVLHMHTQIQIASFRIEDVWEKVVKAEQGFDLIWEGIGRRFLLRLFFLI
jgi:hypothetical protein